MVDLKIVTEDVSDPVYLLDLAAKHAKELRAKIELLQAKLETATNIIKYAERRGFEWPRDPMKAIEMTRTAP